MTVALVLAAEADAGMCGQLAALGVRRVDLAGSGYGGEYGSGLLTVAAAARVAGERVLICVGATPIPGDVLARLLGAGGTTAFTGGGGSSGGALVVDDPDLDTLADAAESLATSPEAEDPLGALLGELARRGVPTRVLDAGPDGEGACAQVLADPIARDVAMWALGRDLAPGALYGISLGLGLIAAVWLTLPTLGGKAIGIAALAGSFIVSRAGALVAAAGRWTGPALEWLGAAAALLTEFAVYGVLAFSAHTVVPGSAGAGLDGIAGNALRNTFAATWGGPGSIGVWRLAIAAMGMLGIRRLADLCYDHAVDGHGLHRSMMRRIEQTITLPTAERYVIIAVTVVFFGARVTFLALLCLGALAMTYVLVGHVLGVGPGGRPHGTRRGSGGSAPRHPVGIDDLAAYRNDGKLARWIGGVVQGRLPPLLPVLVGLMVTCTLSALGLANLPGILVLTPVESMLLAALGSCHPHDGQRDWLVPPLLLAGEFVFLAALGLSHNVPPIAVFVLLGAIVLRHIDVAFRARHRTGISADRIGFGWDGRMLLFGFSAMVGEAPLAYFALSGYLWLLFGWDFFGGWLADTKSTQGAEDLDGLDLIMEE